MITNVINQVLNIKAVGFLHGWTNTALTYAFIMLFVLIKPILQRRKRKCTEDV